MPLDFPNPADTTTYTDITSGNTYIFANGSWSLQNILSATRGGTGFNTYNRGDILFGNASGTLSKLGAGSAGSVLSTQGSGADPTWIAMSVSGGGAGTVATPGARYQIAGYYPGTGASVSGSSTFTNDTSSGIVSITHATGSTSPSFGALLVSGGVGIAGTLSYYKSQLGVAGTTSLPSMAFIGNTNNPVYLNVLENNALSFEGYQGQLLSISPDLNTGYVFTVGDISGIPLFRANANANVTSNEFGGNFGIGTTNPGSKLEVAGNVNITGTAITFFPSATSNYLIMNTGSGGVLRIQTDVVNSRVRMFENMTTTGTLSFFGTSGGTLYLGTDSGTANGNITIRGNNTTGGGGDQRAANFTLATATSNGTGSGGTMLFQTSTSSSVSSFISNILRTRLRIEGAATGTSHFESIIILGDTNSGTAWTSYLRGVDATGTDVSSGEIQIQAGRSTGTGSAQGISFYVSPTGSGSTTLLNTANQIGRFSATGLTINSTTTSTSTSSGALIVAGGVGIGGSLNVEALSKFSNVLEIRSGNELRLYRTADTNYTVLKSADVTSNRTFTLPLTVGDNGQFLTTDGAGVLSFTTDPVQVSSGSVNQIAYYASAGNTVSGSSSFTNNVSGGVVSIAHTTASTGFSSGALVVSGGVGVGGSLRIGDTTTSGSTVTGALTVRGGVGIGGNIYGGGLLSLSSGLTANGAVAFNSNANAVSIVSRIEKSGANQFAFNTLAGNGASGVCFSVRKSNIRDTVSSGSYNFVNVNAFQKISFSTTTAGQTYTNAATVYIEDAPDSSITGALGASPQTVTITNPYALYVESGRTFLGGSIVAGGTGFTKSLGNGDIALDNGTVDTPGLLMYWGNNKNIGIDTFYSGTGTTRFRIVKELNESGGGELWSVDRNGIVTQTAWAVGETIKTQTYIWSDMGMSNPADPVSITSSSYTTIATASYTPSSSTSYLWIEFSATYDYNGGTSADEFAANIEVGGTEIINVFQKFINGSGGGTRSGVLFPLSGRYTNTGTSALSITVRVKRNSADDAIRVFGNSGSGLMRIQEIGR
jgi:hypothetical protein